MRPANQPSSRTTSCPTRPVRAASGASGGAERPRRATPPHPRPAPEGPIRERNQPIAGRGASANFVEALARGLDVIGAFGDSHTSMSLAEIAAATNLARPTTHRLLATLIELGFVRQSGSLFELTPRILDLGYAFVSSQGLWQVARPHLEALVGRTGESSSMAQLSGSDIVYTARVAVPKIIALRVEIGTRFPAQVTSQGKVLLAALAPDALRRTLAEPSSSRVVIAARDPADLACELDEVRARGWALADEELAPGVRSIAAPVSDSTGTVLAAVNVTVHAAETPTALLLERHLPELLATAAAISADWGRLDARPYVEVPEH
ncbi:IclR family transcriptional regulator domain-containing protein [Subtercola sp. RTI3]|uniref:IclR family transcriptional regulator domain-containing protein n=1 Tax=Subtercola sp. RTI3 TaxID=3048639 RepID=UPI002B23B2ED|nr:IclR family transcriptional regulator C-terminal domain-containing protein [Subtercola sp. RTI3]MEA9984120.1 IclR family transcriptional regulator C-terminal domain-containing protein [Subtercola sp. RTI3]